MQVYNTNIHQAVALVMEFARRTGLSSDAPPTRYLWTDAFAVCNFLGLARVTGEDKYRDLAIGLIDQVHETLGRHREDDKRTGWLSKPDDEDGRKHPTRGGLRIGKPLPERKPEETFDERQEWNRDGQYFHYLTKWMHALDLAARQTGEAHYAIWAAELVDVASKAFVYEGPGGQPLMYWKMSIDLSRPLVASMGHHDPLDGYITLRQVRATLDKLSQKACEELGSDDVNPGEELHTFDRMVRGRDWVTVDALGIGGLLSAATQLIQLIMQGDCDDYDLLEQILRSALVGLAHRESSGALSQPSVWRLAFRELGLAIGLRGVAWMRDVIPDHKTVTDRAPNIMTYLDTLSSYLPTADRITSFWLDPENQNSSSWMEHQDINEVMLATALVPDGFLILPLLDE